MRKLLLFVPLICLLASCSEDFQVGAPYKSITVAYGLMDVGDSAHYIRIQKAYYDENTSALVLAKDADSNFFPTQQVHLKELSDTSKNATLINDEVLTRVDLNQEGYAKDSPGVFFANKNYAYKTTRALDYTHAYRVVITNPTTGERDSATTQIIPNTKTEFTVYEFVFNFTISFYNPSSPTARFTVNFRAPSNSQFYQGVIRFHYTDHDVSGKETPHTVDWQLGQLVLNYDPGNPSANRAMQFSKYHSEFYSFLNSAIGNAPNGVVRYMDQAEMIIWAGNFDYYRYLLVNAAQGGLTADQIKPIYTNLKGDNVYGLFASRTYRSASAKVDDASIDTLRARLPNLGFQHR